MRHETMVPLPYELTAEQIASEQLDYLYRKYGDDTRVLMAALRRELPGMIHDGIELGLALGDTFGDVAPAELLVAYAAGANENNGGHR